MMKQHIAMLDGLRTVAVVLVMLNHFSPHLFPFGYIGVDIFFVISGYLISRKSIYSASAHDFNLLKFYKNRFFRIVPALVASVTGCLAVLWLVMLPWEWTTLGQTAQKVVIFFSNVYFSKSDYFSPLSMQNPLLHTWSLGVEEQFYLFIGLLAIAFLFLKKQLTSTICLLIIAISLGLCIYYQGDTKTYFQVQFRMWEFFIGCLLSAMPVAALSRMQQTVLTYGAVATLIITTAFINEATIWPSLYAVFPILATAIIIQFTPANSYVDRFLSLKFMVFSGKISYSLYLWHLPVHYVLNNTLSGLPILGFVLKFILSYLLAYLTWRFIETPFRKPKHIWPLYLFVAWGIGIYVVGYYMAQERLKPYSSNPKFAPLVTNIQQIKHDTNFHDGDCIASDKKAIAMDDSCVIGSIAATPSVALWGDSHSNALSIALSDALDALDISAYQYSYVGCPSALPLQHNTPECEKFSHDSMQAILNNPAIKTVVISNRYCAYVLESSSVFEKKKYCRGNGLYPYAEANEIKGFAQNIALLQQKGKSVILVGQIPQFDRDVPDTMLRNEIWHTAFSPTQTEQQYQHLAAGFKQLSAGLQQVKIIEPAPFLCDFKQTHRCDGWDKDLRLKYYDDNHVSNFGAQNLAQAVANAIAQP